MPKKPNHVCACCGKAYYACNYCDRTGYKWLACSPECFAKVAWRFGSKYAKYKPQRTDMTDEEIEDMLNKPLEQVKAESELELIEYKDELDEIGFNGVMDLINREIDEKEEL